MCVELHNIVIIISNIVQYIHVEYRSLTTIGDGEKWVVSYPIKVITSINYAVTASSSSKEGQNYIRRVVKEMVKKGSGGGKSSTSGGGKSSTSGGGKSSTSGGGKSSTSGGGKSSTSGGGKSSTSSGGKSSTSESSTGGGGESSTSGGEYMMAELIVLGLRHMIDPSTGRYSCPSSSSSTDKPRKKGRKLECILCDREQRSAICNSALHACTLADSPTKAFFCLLFRNYFADYLYEVFSTGAPIRLSNLKLCQFTGHCCAAVLQLDTEVPMLDREDIEIQAEVLLYGTPDVVLRKSANEVFCIIEIGEYVKCMECTSTYSKTTLTGELACNMLCWNLGTSPANHTIYGIAVNGSIEDTTHLHVYKGTIESGKFKLKVLQSFNLRHREGPN